jgi:hypothetical protein
MLSKLLVNNTYYIGVRVMVVNATFNNISAKGGNQFFGGGNRSTRENHRFAASH